MWNWLFVPMGLPKDYTIKTRINALGTTEYLLLQDGRVVAEEMAYIKTHKSCIRTLRRVAWTRVNNGIVD